MPDPTAHEQVHLFETQLFESQRSRLFGIAYRMLGSAHDAEDAVQDTWLRWSGSDHAAIDSVPAFLTTVLTRVCLTRLSSAQARRETYPGPWLPEPVATPDPALGPLDTTEQRESVSFALLVTLELLTPAQRAVYVLREAFGYRHHEVAAVVGVSETHARQLHRRARSRLDEHRRPAADPDRAPAPLPGSDPESAPDRAAGPDRAPGPGRAPASDRAGWARLVERFLTAARDGDLPALEGLLAADVTAWADGGGKVNAARRPVRGRVAVARYLAGISAPRRTAGLRIEVAEVNGEPAVLVWSDSVLTSVLTLDLDTAGAVRTVRFMANPTKLEFLTRRLAELSRSAALPGQP